MKKTIMLVLAAASVAMFALPSVASAIPNHINATTNFTISGTSGLWSTSSSSTWTCANVSGSGAFTNTTGGNLTITFSGTCSIQIFGFNMHCNSAGKTGGHIDTTTLPFDLITISPGVSGILVTTNAGHFASYGCGGINRVIGGNGLIGTLTTPACGGASTTAKAVFEATKHGSQKHFAYTGVNYGLSTGGESLTLSTTATFTFPQSRTLVCT